jgi:hypothetical protein
MINVVMHENSHLKSYNDDDTENGNVKMIGKNWNNFVSPENMK